MEDQSSMLLTEVTSSKRYTLSSSLLEKKKKNHLEKEKKIFHLQEVSTVRSAATSHRYGFWYEAMANIDTKL